MDKLTDTTKLEAVNKELCSPKQLAAYKEPFDDYQPLLMPRLLGNLLVTCGNIVYGNKPSYLKFRAVEVIARVPYHSWASASFTLLTYFYANEERAMELSHTTEYSRLAQDNETMHVIVISQLAEEEAKAGVIRHTLIPMVFAFFYFFVSYAMYVIRPRWSFELNYLFESHAFSQYDKFLTDNEEMLKSKSINSEFLNWYGRNPISQYEFFESVRNDELMHRNQSVATIDEKQDANGLWILRLGVSLLVAVTVFILIDYWF